MKKLVVILLLGMCISFCGCSKEETKCEHQYQSAVTAEASCSNVGTTTFTCTLCNDTYTEEIPALEHTYTKEDTKEPTCVEKGVTTYTCSVCGNKKNEDIATVEHTFGEIVVTKEATCAEEGEKGAFCTVCGATEVTDKIPVVEHTYKSKVSKEATCTTGGEKTLTCSVCGSVKKEGINKLGHDYKQKKVVTKATCTKNGEKIMECTRCGDNYTETISAYGHDWAEATCQAPKTCYNCGATTGNKADHYLEDGVCQIEDCSYHIGLECTATILPSTSMSLVGRHIFHVEEAWANFMPTVYDTIVLSVWMHGAFTYTQDNGICTDYYVVVLYDEQGNIIDSARIKAQGVEGEEQYCEVYLGGTISPGSYTIEFRDAI